MNIDKKLIIIALGLYKEQVVNEDISKHDEMLELLIKLNDQIRLIKEL